ncbi:lipoprotein, partial [mine drainage metagenome]
VGPTSASRPALEDLLGAGAVIDRLSDLGLSPDAAATAAAFRSLMDSIPAALRDTASGQELLERGFPEDVVRAGELGASACVPSLASGGWMVDASRV